jgi:hypothetical protein
MQPDHPKFSFLVAKLQGDRIVQISDWSYNKHAFLSLNNNGTCNGVQTICQQPPAGGAQMGPGCTDVYGNGNNGDRFYLAPPSELNPWLGTWNPVGSYFDRGDPAVTGAAANDGARSLSTQMITGWGDPVKNRVTIREADLQNLTSGTMFFQIQVVHEGEPATNRNNNFRSRPFHLNWTGTTWTASTLGGSTEGTLLTRWPGASLSTAGNGNDDGRFTVAVKVTGPVNGLWHYEYAVLNLDNNRGGASFRIPVCAGARVQNLGVRDIDQNPLNDWTATHAGNEISYLATANNAQRWNQLFNFWFDCDVAPTAGAVTIDQADPGPGALSFQVPTTVPGTQAAVWLGAGCGAPASTVAINGLPTAGNAGFALNLTSAPNTVVLLLYSGTNVTTNLAPGCDSYLDLQSYGTVGIYLTDAAGLATAPIPVHPQQAPAELFFQGAPFLSNAPVLGLVGLTNGLKVRFASTGCN